MRVEHAREQHAVSERRACRVMWQWPGTQCYLPLRRTDEDELTRAISALGGEGRAVRVPAHHHAVAERGVGGGGDRVTDLVRRRAESTAETAGASVVVAGRWIVCAERTNHVW